MESWRNRTMTDLLPVPRHHAAAGSAQRHLRHPAQGERRGDDHHRCRLVPGGGLSPDGTRWIACRGNFFLPVRVPSRLFRRLVIVMLMTNHNAGKLRFFGAHAALAEAAASPRSLAPSSAASGWSMPSHRSAGPRPCSHICRATRSASLEPAPGRRRRGNGHVQIQGLPRRWPRALQGHDARHG
ncbi:MAG: hypothetical protein C0511_06125 [Hyphomicrobium sp.]|nr:hypothetical protein [Hyphomicrobium sp.]